MEVRYCAVKDGQAITGSRVEVVNQIFSINFFERKLSAQAKGFKRYEYHSYGDDWSDNEMVIDACIFLFGKLHEFGYETFYRKID